MDIREVPLSTFAYLGDAVYELFVRERLVSRHPLASGRLHAEAIRYVSATAQAKALEGLLPLLTEAELDLVRRAKNQQPHSLPKHADLHVYRRATAFEALLGRHYYTQATERLTMLLNRACEILEEEHGESS